MASFGLSRGLPRDLQARIISTYVLAVFSFYLVFVGQRRWNIIMKSGQVVMLPAHDALQAVQKIIILDKTEQILSRQIAVFDFRLPSRITLRVPSDKYGQINSEVIGVRN